MFSLICAWINGWVNNREAGDLRQHRAHYDVTVLQRTWYDYQETWVAWVHECIISYLISWYEQYTIHRQWNQIRCFVMLHWFNYHIDMNVRQWSRFHSFQKGRVHGVYKFKYLNKFKWYSRGEKEIKQSKIINVVIYINEYSNHQKSYSPVYQTSLQWRHNGRHGVSNH